MVDPPELDAPMVNIESPGSVGVPLILPVVALNVRPWGRLPDKEYTVGELLPNIL